MYSLIRKAIFSLDPETAHDLVIKSLHLAGKSPFQFFIESTFWLVHKVRLSK